MVERKLRGKEIEVVERRKRGNQLTEMFLMIELVVGTNTEDTEHDIDATNESQNPHTEFDLQLHLHIP